MRLCCLICLSLILVVAPISAQVVSIPDPNLRSAIEETLGLPVSSTITQQEMLRLLRLESSFDTRHLLNWCIGSLDASIPV